MKIRNGFVSNSSSSSFIISLPKEKQNEETQVIIKFKLSDLGSVIKTVEELDQEMIYQYDDMDYILKDDYLRQKYFDCKKALEEGKVLIIGSLSNDCNDPLNYYLYEKGLKRVKFPDNYKLIESD